MRIAEKFGSFCTKDWREYPAKAVRKENTWFVLPGGHPETGTKVWQSFAKLSEYSHRSTVSASVRQVLDTVTAYPFDRILMRYDNALEVRGRMHELSNFRAETAKLSCNSQKNKA
jgi:hypothetical protein